jgi:hypothetical protein
MQIGDGRRVTGKKDFRRRLHTDLTKSKITGMLPDFTLLINVIASTES